MNMQDQETVGVNKPIIQHVQNKRWNLYA